MEVAGYFVIYLIAHERNIENGHILLIWFIECDDFYVYSVVQ